MSTSTASSNCNGNGRIGIDSSTPFSKVANINDHDVSINASSTTLYPQQSETRRPTSAQSPNIVTDTSEGSDDNESCYTDYGQDANDGTMAADVVVDENLVAAQDQSTKQAGDNQAGSALSFLQGYDETITILDDKSTELLNENNSSCADHIAAPAAAADISTADKSSSASPIPSTAVPTASIKGKSIENNQPKQMEKKKQFPPGHVYALRKILVPIANGSSFANNADQTAPAAATSQLMQECAPEREDMAQGKKQKEGPSNSSSRSKGSKALTKNNTVMDGAPRIITSQAVRVTHDVYQSMENSGGGTVLLCPTSWNAMHGKQYSSEQKISAQHHGSCMHSPHPSGGQSSNVQSNQGGALLESNVPAGMDSTHDDGTRGPLSFPNNVSPAASHCQYFQGVACVDDNNQVGSTTVLPSTAMGRSFESTASSSYHQASTPEVSSPNSNLASSAVTTSPAACIAAVQTAAVRKQMTEGYPGLKPISNCPIHFMDKPDDSDYEECNRDNMNSSKDRAASSRLDPPGENSTNYRMNWRKKLTPFPSTRSFLRSVRDRLGKTNQRSRESRSGATKDENNADVTAATSYGREGQERLLASANGNNNHGTNEVKNGTKPVLPPQQPSISPIGATRTPSKSSKANKRNTKHSKLSIRKRKHSKTNKRSKSKSNHNNQQYGSCGKVKRPSPKMVIKNGMIDWESSQLENCGIISTCTTFVAYTATSPPALPNGNAKGVKANGIVNKGMAKKDNTSQAGGSKYSATSRGKCKKLLLPGSSNKSNDNGHHATSKINKAPNGGKGESGGGGGGGKNRTMGIPVVPSTSLGATIFCDEAVIHNNIRPINEIVCVDPNLGIYISESGLSYSDCQNVINVAEYCAASRGGWSSYTYAKQTLGCRENDQLAFVSARPVMTACATIRKHLMGIGEEEMIKEVAKSTELKTDSVVCGDKSCNFGELQSSANSCCHCNTEARKQCSSVNGNNCENNAIPESKINIGMKSASKKKELVLDVREPHVVKYDTSLTERKKLDMHTDKSEWTFLIALTEGRGGDYTGGGTYFQALNCTVHLQRSQMLIFRGKLRHCGVAISGGCRYLLVGFLVPRVRPDTASS